ncbi:MAG: hypothetical protein JNM10_02155 [Planctomycetia bacterium]|nr:hypothetical protein [Planctomycetia bacterium]
MGVSWVLGAAAGALADPGNRALYLGYGFAGVLTIALLLRGRRRRRRPAA